MSFKAMTSAARKEAAMIRKDRMCAWDRVEKYRRE
jgi:hypothetical protein